MKTAITSFILVSVLAIPLSFAGGQYSESMNHDNAMGEMSQHSNDSMMNAKDAQARMHEMREMMEEAHKTTDMNKRHELMRKHMTKMQDMMGNMSMEQRQEMMFKRMDMMQMMMEQMMGHQPMMMNK
jgi:hypothetical protein